MTVPARLFPLWFVVLGSCTPGLVPLGGLPDGVAAKDVAQPAGAQDWEVGLELKRGRGCTVGDFDGDNDLDLALANPGSASYILLNESTPGDLRFRPGPTLDPEGFIWSMAAADIDGDGDLDLALAIGGLEVEAFDRLLINQQAESGTLSFEAAPVSTVGGPTIEGVLEASGSVSSQWVDVDRDGDLDLWVDAVPLPNPWDGDPGDGRGANQLWRNDGNLEFVDIAAVSGLGRVASSRFSSWLDLDGDGDLDLHENAVEPVLSETYRNDDGFFTALPAGGAIDGADARFPPQSFVSLSADFNNDGFDDLLKFARGWATAGPHRLGHTLFLNAGGKGLVDATLVSNLNDPFLGGYRDHLSLGVMGATARDINGDGIPDVFLGNGGPTGGYVNGLFLSTELIDVDFGGTVGVLQVPVYQNASALIDQPAPEDATSGLLWPPYPYRTHAICVADFDEDGLVEAYLMNGGMSLFGGDASREPNQLFTFSFTKRPRFLKVKLRGDGKSVAFTPVGARIAVVAATDDREWVVRDTYRTVEGFAAQHGEVRWLGLADATEIVRVEVAWPDGTQTVVDDVALDTMVEIDR